MVHSNGFEWESEVFIILKTSNKKSEFFKQEPKISFNQNSTIKLAQNGETAFITTSSWKQPVPSKHRGHYTKRNTSQPTNSKDWIRWHKDLYEKIINNVKTNDPHYWFVTFKFKDRRIKNPSTAKSKIREYLKSLPFDVKGIGVIEYGLNNSLHAHIILIFKNAPTKETLTYAKTAWSKYGHSNVWKIPYNLENLADYLIKVYPVNEDSFTYNDKRAKFLSKSYKWYKNEITIMKAKIKSEKNPLVKKGYVRLCFKLKRVNTLKKRELQKKYVGKNSPIFASYGLKKFNVIKAPSQEEIDNLQSNYQYSSSLKSTIGQVIDSSTGEILKDLYYIKHEYVKKRS